jgi:hypothetical protein
MKSILFFLLGVTSLVSHTRAEDLVQNPVLKLYVGSWTGEGTLKNSNGEDLVITEEWVGKAEGDAFIFEGTRTINKDTQPFKWTITHNPGSDSYEALLTGPTGDPLRFEAQISEVNLTLELKAVTGNGNGSIVVAESFSGDGKDEIQSEVTFTGDAGEVNLKGIIKHTRQK